MRGHSGRRHALRRQARRRGVHRKRLVLVCSQDQVRSVGRQRNYPHEKKRSRIVGIRDPLYIRMLSSSLQLAGYVPIAPMRSPPAPARSCPAKGRRCAGRRRRPRERQYNRTPYHFQELRPAAGLQPHSGPRCPTIALDEPKPPTLFQSQRGLRGVDVRQNTLVAHVRLRRQGDQSADKRRGRVILTGPRHDVPSRRGRRGRDDPAEARRKVT